MLGVGLLTEQFDWSFAFIIAPVVTTTSIILSSNKIQNGDILVPANPGSLNWRKSHSCSVYTL